MPPRKTKNSRDKNLPKTESDNDTNDGTEEEMETEDDVDGSGLSSPVSPPMSRSPIMIRHQRSHVSSPASTSHYSSGSGKNTSFSSNNSSTVSDSEYSPSAAPKTTHHSFESSPRLSRRVTATPKEAFSLFEDLHEHESTRSTIQSSFESILSPSGPDNVRDKQDVSQFSMKYKLMVLVFAVFSVVIILCFSPTSDKVVHANQFETFAQNIDKFQHLFPAQGKRFWRTVKASGKHVLNVSDPEYPAILLFVTKSKLDDDQFDAGSCLARKISAEFDSANMVVSSDSPIVDAGKLTTGSSHKQKMDFDNQLHRILDSNSKSVIVEHLELLSPSAALLLHGYCDNDNAPYKDVMIILVLHVENDNISPQAAEALLKQSWETELETDKVDALMSRVANNIVIVNPESISSSSNC